MYTLQELIRLLVALSASSFVCAMLYLALLDFDCSLETKFGATAANHFTVDSDCFQSRKGADLNGHTPRDGGVVDRQIGCVGVDINIYIYRERERVCVCVCDTTQ